VEWDPQFIFGIILLVAWLIFLIIPLSVFNPTLDDYLVAVERISAIFAVALGFVWGYYYAQKNSEKTVTMLRDHIIALQNQLQNQLQGQLQQLQTYLDQIQRRRRED
jgi:hypothetical protein